MTRSTCGANSRAPSFAPTLGRQPAQAWRAYLFSATLALGLAGCGGGGDSAAAPTPAASVPAAPATPASAPFVTVQGALRMEGSTPIAPDDNLRFTATCTGAASYSWDWGDGRIESNTSTNTATHAYSAEGNYTAKVVCNGPRGGSFGEGAVPVEIKMPAATVQVIGSALVMPLQNVSVSATCAGATSYRWNWQDGAATDTNTTESSATTHAYSDVGEYTPAVECLNARGTVIARGATRVKVDVPKHSLSAVSAYTLRSATQTEVSFSATCTGSHSGSVLSYDWDFGDGSPHGEGANPVHIYPNTLSREITATLRCTEDQGLAVTREVTVGINTPTAAPRITTPLVLSPALPYTVAPTTFTMACAATKGGAISYTFDFGDGSAKQTNSTGIATYQYAAKGAELSSNYTVKAVCAESGNGGQAQQLVTSVRVPLISVLAGSSTEGHSDGVGAAASFTGPKSLAADSSGNVYIPEALVVRPTASGFVGLIRKVSATGSTSTFAETGIGATGIIGVMPTSIYIDATDAIYETESLSKRVLIFEPAGSVRTQTIDICPIGRIAADALGSIYVVLICGYVFDVPICGVERYGHTGANYSLPISCGVGGLALDNSGNLYFADTTSHSILKITAAGVTSTLAGNGSSGFVNDIGAAARFNNPTNLAVDTKGNVYVADTGNNAIRKITPDGDVTTIAGSPSGTVFQAGRLPGSIGSPQGIAISGRRLIFSTGNQIAQIDFAP